MPVHFKGLQLLDEASASARPSAELQQCLQVAAKAVELFEERQLIEAVAAFQWARRLLPPSIVSGDASEADRLALAALLNNTGVALIALGRTYQAESLLRQACDIETVYKGERSSEAMAIQSNLAIGFQRRGEIAAGHAMLQSLYDKQLETLGANTEQTLNTKRLMATLDGETAKSLNWMWRTSLAGGRHSITSDSLWATRRARISARAPAVKVRCRADCICAVVAQACLQRRRSGAQSVAKHSSQCSVHASMFSVTAELSALANRWALAPL